MLQLGDYQISNLKTSPFRLDGGAMFGVVPRTMWEKKHPPDEFNRIQMTMNAMLIRDGKRVMIVDSGVGDKFNEKLNAIYVIDHSGDTLLKSLAAADIKPEDVTDVILTHLHFDHAGGVTQIQNGVATPIFPNARHYVQKKQWEWAHAPSAKDRASYFGENYDPLLANGLLTFIEGDKELFPGIELIHVNGHTMAQQIVKVSGGGRTVLHCGDMIPLSSQVPIPWVMAYDLFPLTTLAEKEKLVARAAAEQWMLFIEHDPHQFLLTVHSTSKGYEIRENLTSAIDRAAAFS